MQFVLLSFLFGVLGYFVLVAIQDDRERRDRETWEELRFVSGIFVGALIPLAGWSS